MSKYDDADKSTFGLLRIEAPDDVEIRVANGLVDEISTGFGNRELSVAPGIYTIRWTGGGNSYQELTRIFSGKENPVMRYDDKNTLDEASSVVRVLWKSDNSKEVPGILLVMPWREDRPIASFVKAFRVSRVEELEDSGRRVFKPTVRQLDGVLALAFDVGPGTYVLRYNSVDRIGIEQSIHVYPARITIAMLGLVRSASPEGVGDKAQFRAREGVDPASTRMFSIASRTKLSDTVAPALRLAGTLVSQLGSGGKGLDPALYRTVEKSSDPYLRTYAVALLLGTMKASSPERRYQSIQEDVARQVRDLLSHPNLYHRDRCAPDVECAWWRLAMDNRGVAEKRLDQLELPPMLERCWQWASGWSLVDSGDGDLSPEFVSASVGRLSTGPWLAWRAKATRDVERKSAQLSVASTRSVAGAQDVTSAFSEFVEALQARASDAATQRPDANGRLRLPAINFSTLSATTKKLAANVAALQSGDEKKKLTLLEGLVLTMKTPMSVLVHELQRALDEVKQASSETIGSLNPDDPWKGKFGGRASVDGYTLMLRSWDVSNDPEYLSLDIAVALDKEGATAPRGAVRFFLHPTFKPFTEDVAWIGSTASFKCYAYGGFTIGALVADGTKLELDIALDARLPDWFRER